MANNEIKTAIVVGLDDKDVTKGARNITRATDSMTQRLTRSTQRVNAQFKNMSQGLNNASSGLIGFGAKIAAAYGGAQAIKMVWEFNDGLKDGARRLGWSTQQLEMQKQALFDTTMQYGLVTGELSQYVNEVMRGVKNTEDFENKLKLGAIAMRGLGMSGADAAKMLEKFESIDVSNPEAMMDYFANIGQAKNGRFRADELAMGTMEIMGNNSLSQDPETMKQVGAMLQSLSEDGAPIGDAVNQLSSIISDFSSGSFREFAKERTGEDVFIVQDNKLVLKNLQSLIDIMAEDTKNGEWGKNVWWDQLRTLQGRLSESSATGIQSLAGKGEAVQQIKKSQGVSANQTALDRSRNFDASMSKLMATMQRFADMNLADPTERFAIAMSQLDPSDIQNLMNEAKKAADIIGVAFGVFAGAKALESVSIKSAGTVTVAAVLGKIAIDYFAEKANQKLDERGVKNETDFQMLDREVIKKYSAVAGEGLPNELINALALKVNDWNKLGLHQNQEDMVIAALDFLKNQAGEKAFQDIRANKETTHFAFPWNQIDSNDPAKNLDIINRGKVDFKSGVDVQKLQQDLQKAIDVQKNIENIKFKAQEVDVKISVKSDDNLRVTTISKESTVKGKLGYTGGGDY